MVSDPAADNRLRFWASLPSVRRITILDPLAAGHARALEGVDSRDKPGQDGESPTANAKRVSILDQMKRLRPPGEEQIPKRLSSDRARDLPDAKKGNQNDKKDRPQG